MISYIKGELIETSVDSIVVETGGIGYHIYVPGQVLELLPKTGNPVKLHTFFQVRERIS